MEHALRLLDAVLAEAPLLRVHVVPASAAHGVKGDGSLLLLLATLAALVADAVADLLKLPDREFGGAADADLGVQLLAPVRSHQASHAIVPKV